MFVQSLERRQFMSVTAFGPILRVEGTVGDDMFAISQSDDGTTSTVDINGDVYTGIRFISLDLGDGNDYVEFQGQSALVFIDGGAGDDTIFVTDSGSRTVVRGQSGNDQIFVGEANGTIAFGGEGNDYLEALSASGVATANTSNRVFLLGGEDSDTFNINGAGVTATAGSGDDSFVVVSTTIDELPRIDGGTGYDVVTLEFLDDALVESLVRRVEEVNSNIA